MKIELFSHTPKPVEICAYAASLSHSPEKITQIFYHNSMKNPNSYLVKIMKMGHLSVLEHAYFNFLVEDAPVIVELFAIQFRLASFTVKSRRYTNVIKDGFYQSPHVQVDKEFLKKSQELYQRMIEKNIPLEDARFILPYCFHSHFIFSINARELGYLLATALLEEKTHPDIKIFASRILDLIEDVFPVLRNQLSLFYPHQKKDSLLSSSSLFIPNNQVTLLSYEREDQENYSTYSFFQTNGYLAKKKSEKENPPNDFFKPHNRALETLHYTFFIPGISLAALTHLLRHRMFTPLLPPFFSHSTNYYFLVPPSIKNSPFYEDFLLFCQESKQKEYETQNIYYRLVAALFPLVLHSNARSLIHFIRLRTCERAQWEIREIAKKILFLLREKNPTIFNQVGPSCFGLDFCPEGSHSCGKIKLIKEVFSQ